MRKNIAGKAYYYSVNNADKAAQELNLILNKKQQPQEIPKAA
ncbi:hypothetical protein [Bdellovibrio sp. GT3]